MSEQALQAGFGDTTGYLHDRIDSGIRECASNANNYHAENMQVFSIRFEEGEYRNIVIAHDGKSFDNPEEIESRGCTLLSSARDGMALGGIGLKKAADRLLGADAFVVVGSMIDGAFHAYKGYADCRAMKWKTENVSSIWEKRLRHSLGSHFEQFNVFYVLPVPYDQRKQLLPADQMIGLSFMCRSFIKKLGHDDDGLAITYDSTSGLGPGEVYKSSGGTNAKLPPLDEYIERYQGDGMEFTVEAPFSDPVKLHGGEVQIRASITLRGFPAKRKEGNYYLVSERDGVKYKFEKGTGSHPVPENKAYAYFPFLKDANPILQRFGDNSVYMSHDVNSFLSELDLPQGSASKSTGPFATIEINILEVRRITDRHQDQDGSETVFSNEAEPMWVLSSSVMGHRGDFTFSNSPNVRRLLMAACAAVPHSALSDAREAFGKMFPKTDTDEFPNLGGGPGPVAKKNPPVVFWDALAFKRLPDDDFDCGHRTITVGYHKKQKRWVSLDEVHPATGCESSVELTALDHNYVEFDPGLKTNLEKIQLEMEKECG